jgi:hypothetical protein
MSRDVYQETTELLQGGDVVNRHSFFQMKYFIINKEPTHQAKLWRCMRELYARREVMESMRLELEECHDNLELMDVEMKKVDLVASHTPAGISGMTELNKQEGEIHKRKHERKKKVLQSTIASLEKKLVETNEEAAFFLEAFRSLEKIAPLKPYDDLPSQKEYWNEKITQEFQLRSLLGMPADVDLAKTTMCLMDDMPAKQNFLHALDTRRKLLNDQQNIKS